MLKKLKHIYIILKATILNTTCVDIGFGEWKETWLIAFKDNSVIRIK